MTGPAGTDRPLADADASLVGPQGPLVAYLTGPTAAGKSEVALLLAERHGWSILSVDSRQIYRRLEVGTAKPTPDERTRVPHLLIDLLEPEEPCSAGRFRALALDALRAESKRGRRVLAVGGAGLYWDALTKGLHPLPRGDAEIRARHQEILEREGPEGLHRRLQLVDPETADRLAPRDRQRLSRALEIFEASGRPMSELLRERRMDSHTIASADGSMSAAGPAVGVPGHPSPRVFALRRSREDLARRIERRCAAMLECGLVAELSALLVSGVPSGAPGLQTVGYREFLPHLLEGTPLAHCTERFVLDTRHYAKRQATWLRHRLVERVEILLSPDEPPDVTAGRLEVAWNGP